MKDLAQGFLINNTKCEMAESYDKTIFIQYSYKKSYNDKKMLICLHFVLIICLSICEH